MGYWYRAAARGARCSRRGRSARARAQSVTPAHARARHPTASLLSSPVAHTVAPHSSPPQPHPPTHPSTRATRRAPAAHSPRANRAPPQKCTATPTPATVESKKRSRSGRMGRGSRMPSSAARSRYVRCVRARPCAAPARRVKSKHFHTRELNFRVMRQLSAHVRASACTAHAPRASACAHMRVYVCMRGACATWRASGCVRRRTGERAAGLAGGRASGGQGRACVGA